LEMLLNVSAPGPKVVVPKDGLFKPEFDHHGNLGNSSRDRTGLSGSRERHVGVHLQKMSVGTVFNRYWPAILGLTVGTVFLVIVHTAATVAAGHPPAPHGTAGHQRVFLILRFIPRQRPHQIFHQLHVVAGLGVAGRPHALWAEHPPRH
ncbi:hypothetical protein BaRGS_00030360, partial [Batillaria attramentaria]